MWVWVRTNGGPISCRSCSFPLFIYTFHSLIWSCTVRWHLTAHRSTPYRSAGRLTKGSSQPYGAYRGSDGGVLYTQANPARMSFWATGFSRSGRMRDSNSPKVPWGAHRTALHLQAFFSCCCCCCCVAECFIIAGRARSTNVKSLG